MNSYDFNIVMILPASLQEDGNRMACALGHDGAPLPGNTFNAPLSADGQQPATHFACQVSVQKPFIDLLSAAEEGQLPPIPWADFGLSVQKVAQVLQAMKTKVDIGGSVDFAAFIADENLMVMASPE